MTDPEGNSTRVGSPLCSAEYAHPPSKLPQVVPPTWMKSGMWGAGALTIICSLAVLVSPMDEFVAAPGQVRPVAFAYAFSRADGMLESRLLRMVLTSRPGRSWHGWIPGISGR